MPRILSFLVVFLLLDQATNAAELDNISRAGPIQVHPNECLIAKLSHRGHPNCSAPEISNSSNFSVRAISHLKRAQYFIEIREFVEARQELDAGLRLAPENFELRLLSARLAMSPTDTRTIDAKIAERDLKIAMRIEPNDNDARATYAEYLNSVASPEEAFREFGEVLEANPKHDYSRLARAKIFQAKGRQSEAISDLNIFILRNENSTQAYLLRGMSYLALQESEQAIEDFSTVLKLAPNNYTARGSRAIAYVMHRENDKALAELDLILGPVGANPNYAVGGMDLGKLRMARALLLVEKKRFSDAATDMIASLLTGRTSIIRAQVFLRQNGFPETPLDGKESAELHSALQSCFKLDSCFQKISHSI